MGSLLSLANAGLAQEAAKIDTVLANQKTMMTKLDKIYREVEYVDPLANKTAGVEFNPALLLLASTDDQLVLSGGFSLFDVNAMPNRLSIYYQDAGKTITIPSLSSLIAIIAAS
jgi:hypothetical protein